MAKICLLQVMICCTYLFQNKQNGTNQAVGQKRCKRVSEFGKIQ